MGDVDVPGVSEKVGFELMIAIGSSSSLRAEMEEFVIAEAIVEGEKEACPRLSGEGFDQLIGAGGPVELIALGQGFW